MSTGVPNPNQGSLLHGHAQYMKGYINEAIGQISGSESRKDSGKTEMREGIDELKVSSSFLITAYRGMQTNGPRGDIDVWTDCKLGEKGTDVE
jgi:hypothetical protein